MSGTETAPLTGPRKFLTLPLRAADDTAKVDALETRILIRQNIRLYIAKCRHRLVLDAVVKGLNDVFFEVLGARIRGNDCLAINIRKFRIGDSKYVHLDAVSQQRNHRMHVLRNS